MVSVALEAPYVVKPKGLAPPKRTKLLGAIVRDIGTITTVAKHGDCWALIETADGTEKHVFACDLSKDMLSFPSERPEYTEVTRRIGYGLFAEVFQLKSVVISDLTHVDPAEQVA